MAEKQRTAGGNMNGVDPFVIIAFILLPGIGYVIGYFAGIVTATEMNKQEGENESSD